MGVEVGVQRWALRDAGAVGTAWTEVPRSGPLQASDGA
jgi:hypothetical protein